MKRTPGTKGFLSPGLFLLTTPADISLPFSPPSPPLYCGCLIFFVLFSVQSTCNVSLQGAKIQFSLSEKELQEPGFPWPAFHEGCTELSVSHLQRPSVPLGRIKVRCDLSDGAGQCMSYISSLSTDYRVLWWLAFLAPALNTAGFPSDLSPEKDPWTP